MKMFRSFMVFPAVLMLTACSIVPLTSYVPLARIDPMTTDLGRLRAALRLPPALRPQPDGVHLDVTVKVAGQPDIADALALVPVNDPAERVGLPPASEGEIYVYKLAPDEIARLDAMRQRVATANAAGQSGSLGFGLSARQFCVVGALPTGPLPASTYLLTSENANFVALADGLDLRSDPTVAQSLASISACP